MLKHGLAILLVVLQFALLAFLPIGAVIASEEDKYPAIPIVSEINERPVENPAVALIAGFTERNTEVLIYIDGSFVDFAAQPTNDKEQNDFSYFLRDELAEGNHTVFAVARDLTSLVLSPPTMWFGFKISSRTALDAPTLIEPRDGTVTSDLKPLITGLTVSGTAVQVFIDGNLNGTTGVLNDSSGTANFAYKPFLNLSQGNHEVYTVAFKSDGAKSGKSNILNFRVEAPLPAPTLIDTIKNTDDPLKPIITGVSKNDTDVKIFIDKELDGEFSVENDPSGTASFSYKPFERLAIGAHLVYATAVDTSGKESSWSNIIKFTIDKIGRISDEAAEDVIVKGFEEQTVLERIGDILTLARLFGIGRQVVVSPAQVTFIEDVLSRPGDFDLSSEEILRLEVLLEAEKEKIATEETATTEDEVTGTTDSTTDGALPDDIRELIDEGISEEGQTSGLIDESKESQGKLRLNLAIFILFLLAVIIWIFWVNRELIRERRTESVSADSDGNNDIDEDDFFGGTPPDPGDKSDQMKF